MGTHVKLESLGFRLCINILDYISNVHITNISYNIVALVHALPSTVISFLFELIIFMIKILDLSNQPALINPHSAC